LKNLCSFALIGILLLNVLGYYGVFLGLEYQNQVAMIERLDSNRYDESQAITIKISIAVPYMSDNAGFERVDGMFEYNGEFFRLVKQKYAKDTLTVICVRDTENKRIHQALSDYVTNFTDNPAGEHPNSKLTLSFIKDYIPQSFTLKTICPGWQSDVIKAGFCIDLIPTFVPSVIHPPERA
jgi:hypothetical protein